MLSFLVLTGKRLFNSSDFLFGRPYTNICLTRPLYLRGTAIGCGLTGLISVLALGLHFALERENKRRDREHGPVDSDMAVDVTELGDKNKNFRYLT